MILARIFTKIYKEGGIILIDAKGQKYICGNPRKEKPITVKLLKKNLPMGLPLLYKNLHFLDGNYRDLREQALHIQILQKQPLSFQLNPNVQMDLMSIFQIILLCCPHKDKQPMHDQIRET